MDTYYNVMFKVFSYASLALGALAVVLLVLVAIAWTANQIYTSRKYWRVLAYATAIQMRGGRAADQLFWKALDEKASQSKFEAERIVERASKHLPPNT